MNGLAAIAEQLRGLDESSQAGWLAQIDPRALILATLSFLVAVLSCDRYAVAALLPLALFPVVLARLSNISLCGIGGKVLLAMPFALMIGLFNPLFDSAPRLFVFGVPVSGGWLSFASIGLRAALSVAAALILVGALGFNRLCAGLSQLGVPAVLTTQLLFMHRYILLLAGELGRLDLARALRSETRKSMPLRVYGSLLGHLLLRTLARAQRIHQAMLARGFAGQLAVPVGRSWQRIDSLFLGATGAGLLLLRSGDPAAWLGRLLLGVLP